MDKLVIDASVAVKWFVVEPFSREARRVLSAYQNGAISFYAPDIFIAEFANTIWKKQLFQGLAETDAADILTAFGNLDIALVPTSALLSEAYQLATTHRRAIYDALYLALSVRENCNLVTADERLVNALSLTHSQIVLVSDW